MAVNEYKNKLSSYIKLSERNLSVLVHSLFSAWMLAFIFEGQILYSLINGYKISPEILIFGGIAANFMGLFSSGFFIKTKKAARNLFLASFILFIGASLMFFSPPSIFWTYTIVICSFLSGACVAAWGLYLKSSTPQNQRIKTIADMLILSNILMIFLNILAIYMSAHFGLIVAIVMLTCAFLLALRLPKEDILPFSPQEKKHAHSINGILIFLCSFIVIISINSGLMYQVIKPGFAQFQWLTSWYWALPYIGALFIMRNLSPKINRSYILYLAIAMIGISFIAFIGFKVSVFSYLFIDTLMLGAFGVYDLFLWSILGEMLEFHENPAKILGIGLSSNVLGVLMGGLIGSRLVSGSLSGVNSILVALTVVCVTLALLPPLHKRLSNLLKDHAYLEVFSDMPLEEQNSQMDNVKLFGNLSERESQVATLLLQGKTYKTIAGELFISENTVKYYVKNIYSKFNIQSRTQLIELVQKKEISTEN